MTYPQKAGDLKKGSYVMIKNAPCKVVEISSSLVGKHGHSKIAIVGIHVFSEKKYEDVCPSHHNVDCPFVQRTEYVLSMLDETTGAVSVITDTGALKTDLNLPTVVKVGRSPSDEDVQLRNTIVKGYEAGKMITVAVLSACSEEKIVGAKLTD